MDKIFHQSPASSIQNCGRKRAIVCKEVDSNDEHSNSISEPTIENPWPMDCSLSNIFEDINECSREDAMVDWCSVPIFDEYHDEVQEPTYDEELEVDLNEDYQDGDCAVESFDIQLAMTTQEDELFYSMVVVGKDVELATYVLSEVQSLLKGFNGLTLEEVLAGLPPLCDVQHHIEFIPGVILPILPYYRIPPSEHVSPCRIFEKRFDYGVS